MKALLLIIVLFFSLCTIAGQGTGKITFLGANHGATPVWIFFNIENYANHACATPNSTHGKLWFTTDSARGKEMLSILLSAESRQVPVTVVGTGTCVEQNRESINYIYLGNPSS